MISILKCSLLQCITSGYGCFICPFFFLNKTLKIALSMASGLGDTKFDSSLSEVVTEMLRYSI